MSVFSENELDYLASKRLGRLSTIGTDGFPHVVPLGWSYNPALDTIDIGGRDLARTKKFRNVKGGERRQYAAGGGHPHPPPAGHQLGPGRQGVRAPTAITNLHA